MSKERRKDWRVCLGEVEEVYSLKRRISRFLVFMMYMASMYEFDKELNSKLK